MYIITPSSLIIYFKLNDERQQLRVRLKTLQEKKNTSGGHIVWNSTAFRFSYSFRFSFTEICDMQVNFNISYPLHSCDIRNISGENRFHISLRLFHYTLSGLTVILYNSSSYYLTALSLRFRKCCQFLTEKKTDNWEKVLKTLATRNLFVNLLALC